MRKEYDQESRVKDQVRKPMKFYLLATATLSVLLSACASPLTTHSKPDADHRSSELTDTFCDSYFIYAMCARDINHDDLADFMYFEDTGEIFMQTDEIAARTSGIIPAAIPADWGSDLTVHKCAQTMDEELQHAASLLFTINGKTGALRKTQIKSQLILSYSRYMGRINRCNSGSLAMPSTEDSFGDIDYDDL